MGKYIDTDALKNANFRTRLGLKSFIDSLSEAVTRCAKCENFEPPTNNPQHPYGNKGICKVYNMFKNPTDFCSEGKPRDEEVK